jgi:hypothetical protein
MALFEQFDRHAGAKRLGDRRASNRLPTTRPARRTRSDVPATGHSTASAAAPGHQTFAPPAQPIISITAAPACKLCSGIVSNLSTTARAAIKQHWHETDPFVEPAVRTVITVVTENEEMLGGNEVFGRVVRRIVASGVSVYCLADRSKTAPSSAAPSARCPKRQSLDRKRDTLLTRYW